MFPGLRRSSSKTPKKSFRTGRIQRGGGSRCPGFPPQAMSPLFAGGSLLHTGRVEVRILDPTKLAHAPRERKNPHLTTEAQLSPISHHRGGYSTARTVADWRVHLQNPLGHKRLQTFPCEERRGEAGPVREWAALGHTSGMQSAAGAPSRHEYAHPPQSNFQTHYQPCCAPHPRGSHGDVQGSEPEDPAEQGYPPEGCLLLPPASTPPSPSRAAGPQEGTVRTWRCA